MRLIERKPAGLLKVLLRTPIRLSLDQAQTSEELLELLRRLTACCCTTP